jgi:hypothetical protein
VAVIASSLIIHAKPKVKLSMGVRELPVSGTTRHAQL